MRIALFVLLTLAPRALPAQEIPDQWHSLIDSKKFDEAEKLCKAWAASAELEKKVEAQKCLANIVLGRGSAVGLLGNDQGGGTLGEGYAPEAIDQAIKYLDEGIRLAPQDVTIHQGRLHILEVSGRFDAMAKALDESATIYTGKDALEAWLAYAAELADMGQLRAGLQFCEVLDQHYPGSHDVVGNIGAFHSMLKETDAAMPYLKKAVELAPSDPIDTWNLARAYDALNQNELADSWYKKSLALDSSSDGTGERKCFYGKFLDEKLHEKSSACQFERAGCEKSDRAACAPAPKEKAPPP